MDASMSPLDATVVVVDSFVNDLVICGVAPDRSFAALVTYDACLSLKLNWVPIAVCATIAVRATGENCEMAGSVWQEVIYGAAGFRRPLGPPPSMC